MPQARKGHGKESRNQRLTGSVVLVTPFPLTYTEPIDSIDKARVRFAVSGKAMGRNKKLRVRIASLEQRITDHQIKIAIGRQHTTPNVSLIRHWVVEIKAWEQTVGQLTRRLKKGNRRD